MNEQVKNKDRVNRETDVYETIKHKDMPCRGHHAAEWSVNLPLRLPTADTAN